jgi:hypothetical protein
MAFEIGLKATSEIQWRTRIRIWRESLCVEDNILRFVTKFIKFMRVVW